MTVHTGVGRCWVITTLGMTTGTIAHIHYFVMVHLIRRYGCPGIRTGLVASMTRLTEGCGLYMVRALTACYDTIVATYTRTTNNV